MLNVDFNGNVFGLWSSGCSDFLPLVFVSSWAAQSCDFCVATRDYDALCDERARIKCVYVYDPLDASFCLLTASVGQQLIPFKPFVEDRPPTTNHVLLSNRREKGEWCPLLLVLSSISRTSVQTGLFPSSSSSSSVQRFNVRCIWFSTTTPSYAVFIVPRFAPLAARSIELNHNNAYYNTWFRAQLPFR